MQTTVDFFTKAADEIQKICDGLPNLVARTVDTQVTPRMDSRGFKGALPTENIDVSAISLQPRHTDSMTGKPRISELQLSEETVQALYAAGAERISFGNDEILVHLPCRNTLDI